jgi:hypothetical protein
LNAGNQVEQALGFIVRFVSTDLSGVLDTATRQLALPATQARTLFFGGYEQDRESDYPLRPKNVKRIGQN